MRILTLSAALLVLGCSATSHLPATDAGTETADARIGHDAAPSVDAGALADAAAPVDAAIAPDAHVEPDAGPAPSFDSIYESILVPRCGSCHIDEDGSSFSYRPRLTDVDTAYAALVDVPVETGWADFCFPDGVTPYRVRPRDTVASMLAILPECYVRDADHELSPDELARIRAWISSGAPREPF